MRITIEVEDNEYDSRGIESIDIRASLVEIAKEVIDDPQRSWQDPRFRAVPSYRTFIRATVDHMTFRTKDGSILDGEVLDDVTYTEPEIREIES